MKNANEKKKVLIVANAFMGQELSSNNRSVFLPKFLSENGLSVEIIFSNFNHHTKEYVYEHDHAGKYKVTLLSCISYRKNVSFRRFTSEFLYSFNLRRYLHSLDYAPDLVYIFCPSLDVARVALKFARSRSIPAIIDVRDLWPEAFYMLTKSKALGRVIFYPMEILANSLYQGASAIVAVSATYLNRASSVRKRPCPSAIVTLGTSFSYFDVCGSNHSLRKFQKADGEIHFAVVCTLGTSYDLITLFNAFKKLIARRPMCKLHVFGSGPLAGKFISYAKRISSSIYFWGRLPYEEMVANLSLCDIVINSMVPNSPQSLTNKHADYSASGLPVINNQECAEYRELIELNRCGINCCNGSSDSLFFAMCELVDNPDLMLELGLNHRRMGEYLFDRDVTYSKLLSFLESQIK